MHRIEKRGRGCSSNGVFGNDDRLLEICVLICQWRPFPGSNTWTEDGELWFQQHLSMQRFFHPWSAYYYKSSAILTGTMNRSPFMSRTPQRKMIKPFFTWPLISYHSSLDSAFVNPERYASSLSTQYKSPFKTRLILCLLSAHKDMDNIAKAQTKKLGVGVVNGVLDFDPKSSPHRYFPVFFAILQFMMLTGRSRQKRMIFLVSMTHHVYCFNSSPPRWENGRS